MSPSPGADPNADGATTSPSGHGAGRGSHPSEIRLGVIVGIVAYTIWGFFPIYFHALEPASAIEILSHRIIWSLLVVSVALAVRKDWSWVGPFLADRSQVLELVAAATLIAINWLVYVWAVGQDRVLEASLGYFINPLVTVAFGVVLLNERLRSMQWLAVGLGAAAVLVITIAYGSFPFISLTLAFSFAGYGYIKKKIELTPLRSLTAETAVLSPVAVVVVGVLWSRGTLEFGPARPGLSALLAMSGLVTAVPLILFAASARRIPLTLLGLLQYLTPVMQFVCAVFVFHESMPTTRWIGFGLVWAALALLSLDSLLHYRSSPPGLAVG